jgi:uncharacterized membrane protein YkoI
MNKTNSLNFLFLAGLLTATIGLLPLINSNTALAQTNTTSGINTTNMTGEDNTMMMKDNYGKSMMGKEHKKYEKINGTLNMMETMYQAIGEKINVTLSEAISTAEQSVGNGTMAMSANGAEKDGFLVFEILLGSPDMKFTKVLVDSGNGQVLKTEPVSMMEWMMMMHSQGHGDYDKGMKGMHSGSYGGSQGYGDYDKGMKGMHSGSYGGSQGSSW